MSAAAMIVIMLAIAYAIVLLALGQENQKVLVIWTDSWQYKLPFAVSPWWNMVIYPIAVFAIMHLSRWSPDFIGKEYHGEKSASIHTREAKWDVDAVSITGLVFVSCLHILALWIDLVLPDPYVVNGPLYWLVIFVPIFLAFYIAFAFIIEFGRIIFIDLHYQKMDLSEYYISKLTKFVKMGTLKTSPFIIGLTAGFMIRVVCHLIWRLLGPVVGSAIEEEAY